MGGNWGVNYGGDLEEYWGEWWEKTSGGLRSVVRRVVRRGLGR